MGFVARGSGRGADAGHQPAAASITAIRAGRLPDPDAGRVVTNQVILVEGTHFAMKDGMVFKKDGVMTPAAFFHAGPVNGWRIR